MSMMYSLSSGFSGLRASLQLLGTVADEIGGSGTWSYDDMASAVQAAQPALAPNPHVRSGPEVQPGKMENDARKPAIIPAPEMVPPGPDSLNPARPMDFTGALTTMLMARRSFEANSRVVATSDKNLRTLISLTV